MTTPNKRDFRTFQNEFMNYDSAMLSWLAALLQAEAYLYLDKRSRSNQNSPPPVPMIKIDMIDKEVMEFLASAFDQQLITLKRKTNKKNIVYRVNVSSRKKIQVILKTLFPYFIGEKTRSKIQELLDCCSEYDIWLNSGGKSDQAKRANLARQESKLKKTE